MKRQPTNTSKLIVCVAKHSISLAQTQAIFDCYLLERIEIHNNFQNDIFVHYANCSSENFQTDENKDDDDDDDEEEDVKKSANVDGWASAKL